jgi:uncharacterized membrane protein
MEPRAAVTMVGGGALALYGLSHRSLPGALIAAVAGGLAVGATTARRVGARAVHVRRAVTINAPPREVYRFWRHLENLPRFLDHLEAVHVTDGRRSHWLARGPLGERVEWDAEIVEDREAEYIGWRALEGAEVANEGTVRFARAPGGRGTEVTASLRWTSPAGRVGAAVARLVGGAPDVIVREGLRRVKAIIEAGEIPTTAGQPSGRSGERG